MSVPDIALKKNHADRAAKPVEKTYLDGPKCKECGAVEGAILYRKYGYYFKCEKCPEKHQGDFYLSTRTQAEAEEVA